MRSAARYRHGCAWWRVDCADWPEWVWKEYVVELVGSARPSLDRDDPSRRRQHDGARSRCTNPIAWREDRVRVPVSPTAASIHGTGERLVAGTSPAALAHARHGAACSDTSRAGRARGIV